MNNLTCKNCHWKVPGAVDPNNVAAPRQTLCTANGPTFVMFVIQPPASLGARAQPQIGNGSGYPMVTDASPACRHHATINTNEDGTIHYAPR